MTDERSAKAPMLLAALLVAAALVLHGSWLGLVLGVAATVPAGYTCWLGTQSQGQGKLLGGLLLLLAGLAAAAIVILVKIFGWLT